eukprot:13493537-Ditylum_brightwellii.AAC.1
MSKASKKVLTVTMNIFMTVPHYHDLITLSIPSLDMHLHITHESISRTLEPPCGVEVREMLGVD